jgi:hypothetical protein
MKPPRRQTDIRPRTRILLSEGSSTSARQAITALALKGYDVEICDPDPHCLGRFSRLISRFHRCPGLGIDPQRFLSFILDQISTRRFDVLLPIHEQGFLFARVSEQITPHVALALPSFESYECVHNKAGFSRLLSELGLPQPETRFLENHRELLKIDRFPFVLKTALGTASRGTWMIHHPMDLGRAVDEIGAAAVSNQVLLVQELVVGSLEQAQAVFCKGLLVGIHVCRQVTRGAGGGAALKESVYRPVVRSHLAQLGERLCWHGALSVDYVVDEKRQTPLYIDCNPRLVEPMSAQLSGLDLADLLVRVSLGEAPSGVLESREGVRTHMALQALLGCALRRGSRWEILRECWRLLARRGPYAGSREELTPARIDWPSVLPVAMTALWLLVDPKAADYLPRKRWGSHLLNQQSVLKIRERIGSIRADTVD